jgi:class 3 adenylate cyclase
VVQVLDRALCPVLVGRADQLEALEDALLASNRGEGQVVVLAGEAGMGKSRLADELRAVAQRAGTIVMEGSCSEAELALPYLPFLEAIGNYLSIADLDELRQRLGPFRRELAQLFPQVDPEAGHGDSGDPTQGRLRLFEALIALLRIPADEHGVLLIIEDIHWADASTRELLDYMTRRLRTTRIMVLATYRSDELHRRHPLLPLVQGWRRSGTARIVELEPLDPSGIAEMVKAIFDEAQVSDEFRDLIFQRSEGNPFVAEEILKAAIDKGDIYRAAGGGWDRRALKDLTLPTTVTDSVLLRLERLNDEQADILHAAAVLGRSFDYRTLAAVAGPSEDRIQEGLHLFVQQQLMEEEAASHRYRFRHALTREAIYSDLITPRRLALHSRAADTLAKLPGTPPVDLAYHLLAAGRTAEAIPVALEAAADAERRLGFREAVTLYERIVPLVTDELPRAELLGRLGRALYWAGEGVRGEPYLEEAIPPLERDGRIVEAANLRLWLGRIYWERSRPEEARAEYEHVRDALEPLGPSDDLANAYSRLAGIQLFAYELERCESLALKARDIAIAAGDEPAKLWAEVFIGSALAAMPGREEEGYETLMRVEREALERGYPWVTGNATFNELETRIFNYRPRQALDRLELYRDLARGRLGGPWPGYVEGAAHVFMGEPQVARPLLEESTEQADAAGLTTFEGWSRRFLAVALSMLDEHEAARAALPGPSNRNERQDAVPVATFSIRIFEDAGDAEATLAEARSAIDLLAVRPNDWVVEERRLADQVIGVLLGHGRDADAERAIALLRGANAPRDDPYLLRTEGRIALAAGRPNDALAGLELAATAFRNADYRDDEWRTRRVLAEALAAVGQPDAAERQLRQVLLEAQEHGHVAEARRAREALGALGAAAETAGGEAAANAANVAVATKPAAGEASKDRGRSSTAGRPTEVVATIMFLDVRGYTQLTGQRAPKDNVERLASLHRWARQEVERHDGTVDKFAGDAVMAVFNASGARLDHAVHAVQAALAIRDKAAYAGMPVGIGLATGPAVVGNLTDGANVSAVGETTNLAARLQSAAGAGEILLSAETHRRVREWLASRALSPRDEELQLKGVGTVPAYRLAAG